jgi:hypothetical protein
MLNLPVLPRHPLVLAAVLLAGSAAGCGAAKVEDIPVFPVKGRVTIDTRPLTGGRVGLHPVEGAIAGADNRVGFPYGMLNSSGTYTVYFRGREGAPLGVYKVTVDPADTWSGPRPSSKYSKLEETDLQVEVTESPPDGAFDLHLKR